MGIAGFGKTELRYDMFDIVRNADEARRMRKCESIYHKGQTMAWDGKEILPMLLEKHGGVHVPAEKKEALKRLFAIILWGELAAWKISLQLADGLVPLEAKMAATSQAHDDTARPANPSTGKSHNTTTQARALGVRAWVHSTASGATSKAWS